MAADIGEMGKHRVGGSLRKSHFCGMIITIARQCGCGAVNVGKILSAQLGIPFYTRQDLMDMAEARGLGDTLNDVFEERPADELLFAISSFGEERTRSTDRLLHKLSEMVGPQDCIIIGRCGNYIFRERKDLVSVFLGGSLDVRIANIEREQHLSTREAQEFVEHTDDCRAAYHKYYTGLTWGNAADYDICLDCVRLGTEQTAAVIHHYAKSLGLTKEV